MASILLGWELGNGIGYARRLSDIADRLGAEGHKPVLALRDPSRFPAAYRSGALWAESDAAVAPTTRAALQADPDLDALTTAALRAVVDHHVPAPEPSGPNDRGAR